jgi:hypothetical protein
MARNLGLAGLLLFLFSALGDQGLVPVFPARFVQPKLTTATELPATRPVMRSLLREKAAVQKPTAGSFLGRRPRIPLVKIKELEPAVKKYARLHGVDEALVWAVMRHESGFNPQAVSPAGAIGLMQLMPGTASLMGVGDPFNIEQNIAAGIAYLEYCLSRFHQDLVLALAAYNAGPQNVSRYQGCPPFPQTRQYVAAVLQTYGGSPQYRNSVCAASVTDEVPALLPEAGLCWRVPEPRWKVNLPQVRVKEPRWKGPLATRSLRNRLHPPRLASEPGFRARKTGRNPGDWVTDGKSFF